MEEQVEILQTDNVIKPPQVELDNKPQTEILIKKTKQENQLLQESAEKINQLFIVDKKTEAKQ